jgi:signal transduction histidine kinase
MTNSPTREHFPPPPFLDLRARLLAHAESLEAEGASRAAGELRNLVASWWDDQSAWNGSVAGLLGLHHDINNALVGVRGNAQLLLMGPAAQQPGVKDRLEVVMRESQRIKEAASRLGELKAALTNAGPASRAA